MPIKRMMLIVMTFQAFSIGPVGTGRCSSDSERDDGNAAVIFCCYRLGNLL